MTSDWSSEERGEAPSPSSSEDDLAPAEHETEDTTTAPLAVIPTPPTRQTRPFRIWSPHDPDLTDKMRYDIEVHMSAGYWLQQALQEQNRVELPEEFGERSFVLKLILQEFLVVLGVGLVLWALVAIGLKDWLNLVALGVVLVGAIVAFYMYTLWSITYHVVTATKTGISREKVGWMFINEIIPELVTTAIVTSKPHRNGLLGSVNIPWWRVYLETAAFDESPRVKRLRFVRHGPSFAERIDQFKLALR